MGEGAGVGDETSCATAKDAAIKLIAAKDSGKETTRKLPPLREADRLPTVDDVKNVYLGQGGRRAARELWERRRRYPPRAPGLAAPSHHRRNEEEGGERRRGQVRNGARRAGVLLLRNERGVRGMVRREEERPVGERLGTVDVPERSAQNDGSQNERDKKAREKPLHGGPDSTLRAFKRT